MDGYPYDLAGNLQNDGNHGYSYDAENRVSQVGPAGSTAAYVYDAAGQRVRKTSSAGTVDYIYDLAGHEVAEVSSAGVWNRGEVYAGGRHLATYDGGTTYFNHADWLGTERARSSLAAMLCETIISLPFGDGQAPKSVNVPCVPSDPSPMHFTGKERDAETGLDYFGARYNASNMGRFMTPDPLGGSLVDPQTLNKYAYTRNNPVNLTDPTGLYTCRDDPKDGSSHCASAADVKFEKTLATLRNSSNADVARAAAAYGAVNKDNGVTVGFADLSTKGEGGDTVSRIGSDSNGNLRADSDVTINSRIDGDSYAAAIGHEGSHAADAQDVVRSGITGGLLAGQPIYAGMDITHYQSEVRAWGVTESILKSGNFTQKFDCGTVTCTLGANVAIGDDKKLPSQLGEVIDTILAHQPRYNQGGSPMGPGNRGGNIVNGVTLTPRASVPR